MPRSTQGQIGLRLQQSGTSTITGRRSQIISRPPKAIFDLGNTNPDLVGAHRGMGTDGSGSGSQGGEPAPILYERQSLTI
jgi:hypothetical protein